MMWGYGSWWCDDKKRHVSRCSSGVDEFDNPLGPPQYYLYCKDKPGAVRVYFIIGRFISLPVKNSFKNTDKI